MAEALLRHRMAAAGLNPRIESAGVGAVVGAGAHEHARTVMAEAGIALDDHVARQFDGNSDARFELILVMDNGHKGWIERRFPQLGGRTFRLGHWLEKDIDDPIGQEVGVFRMIRDEIDRAIDSWFERLGIQASADSPGHR
jgi:protein-tyrosine phosphatase